MIWLESVKFFKRITYLIMLGSFTLMLIFTVMLPFSCLAYSYRKIYHWGGEIVQDYIPPLIMILVMTLILVIMRLAILYSLGGD